MDDGRRVDRLAFLQPVWYGLRQPWLLLVSSGLVILLLLVARAVPQLPALLANDPAASARWLRAASQDAGLNNPVVQTLGLFDVLHSYLLRLLMLWMGLLLTVQFSEQLGIMQQLRALPALLNRAPAQAGVPLLRRTSTPLSQQRFVTEERIETVAARYIEEMQPLFGVPVRCDIGLATDLKVEEVSSEIRLLGIRNRVFGYLRLLLIGSILAALIIVWWIAQQSWQIPSFLLAPGDSVRYGALQLSLAYETTPATDDAGDGVMLQVQLGELVRPFIVNSDGATLRLGQINISGNLGPPGLQVGVVDGARLLARPSQAGVSNTFGLVFPNEGDEEFILIPQAAAALRILRAANRPAPYFLVEVYNQTALDEGNAQPVQRFEVTQRQELSIPAQGAQLPLTFDPRPSVVLQAQSLPGLWLLWPTLVAVALGSISLWRRPAFQLVQIAPWPDAVSNAAVVILQGSR